MPPETNYVFVHPPPLTLSPPAPALTKRTPTEIIRISYLYYLFSEFRKTIWVPESPSLLFPFYASSPFVFTFGYLRLCSWAFSCTCMELYKSATRFLQLAGGCLKKCSFFIFLSPQQSTETLVCGPPTPYILYPPPC